VQRDPAKDTSPKERKTLDVLTLLVKSP